MWRARSADGSTLWDDIQVCAATATAAGSSATPEPVVPAPVQAYSSTLHAVETAMLFICTCTAAGLLHACLHLTSGSCAGRKALSGVTWLKSSCFVVALHCTLGRFCVFVACDRAVIFGCCRASDIIRSCYNKRLQLNSGADEQANCLCLIFSCTSMRLRARPIPCSQSSITQALMTKIQTTNSSNHQVSLHLKHHLNVLAITQLPACMQLTVTPLSNRQLATTAERQGSTSPCPATWQTAPSCSSLWPRTHYGPFSFLAHS